MITHISLPRSATLLALALLAGAIPPAAADPGDLPVMPVLHWNAETRQVIVTPPVQVISWMRGQLDDPDGALSSWLARYDRQRQTPGFAQAILQLQDLAREAADAGATPFQVEHEVIPRILEQRGDIRDGLYGRGQQPTWRRCFMQENGHWHCDVREPFLGVCIEWRCIPDSESNECIATKVIPCPVDASSPGHDLEVGQR